MCKGQILRCVRRARISEPRMEMGILIGGMGTGARWVKVITGCLGPVASPEAMFPPCSMEWEWSYLTLGGYDQTCDCKSSTQLHSLCYQTLHLTLYWLFSGRWPWRRAFYPGHDVREITGTPWHDGSSASMNPGLLATWNSPVHLLTVAGGQLWQIRSWQGTTGTPPALHGGGVFSH